MNNPNEKPKHTPGPWKVLYSSNEYPIISFSDTNIPLAVLYETYSYTDRRLNYINAEANAALIAAAPEMLEALEGAIDFLNEALHEFNDKSFIEKMRQAVSKARGES